jgi:hypothetical protein
LSADARFALPPEVPSVNPRLAAGAVVVAAVSPAPLPNGFIFCHQLVFFAGFDVTGPLPEIELEAGI